MLQGLIILRAFFAQHARFLGSHKAFGKLADNLTGQSRDKPGCVFSHRHRPKNRARSPLPVLYGERDRVRGSHLCEPLPEPGCDFLNVACFDFKLRHYLAARRVAVTSPAMTILKLLAA